MLHNQTYGKSFTVYVRSSPMTGHLLAGSAIVDGSLSSFIHLRKKKMAAYVEEDVVIIGAGIAGLATALALKRVGVRALVIERSTELRTEGSALNLFPNAWLALDALGVSDKLASIYTHYTKALVTDVATGATQEVSLVGTNKDGSGPRCVHRKVLLETLAHELPKGSIRFSCKFTSIETKVQDGTSFASISLEDGTTIKSKVLVGCDGVHSKVARWLGLSEPVDSGRWAVRGLAVYPDGHGFDHKVQQFVDVGRRGAMVPLNDNEVFWFIAFYYTSKGEKPKADPKSIQEAVINDYAKGYPPLFIDVVNHSDISTLSLAPLIFRYPWDVILGNSHKSNVTLAGDAMHPMTPDLGQGGGCALEDAVVLGRNIGESFIKHGKIVPEEVPAFLGMYVKERKWRAALLISGAYLSGWAQQNGSGLMKFIRNVIFYKIFFKKLLTIAQFDCGKLPLHPSPDEVHDTSNHTKLE